MNKLEIIQSLLKLQLKVLGCNTLVGLSRRHDTQIDR